MANLSQRVAKLEDTAAPDGRVIVMWKHVDETTAQARAAGGRSIQASLTRRI
jgi:hypothetical protein